MPNYLQSQVIEKTMLNENVVELRLAKPEGFSYVAGQFIQLVVSKNEPLVVSPTGTEPVIRRSYSISSTPNDPYIELCIKYVPGGVGSTYVAQLSVGDSIQFLGPNGRFIARNPPESLSCIATGVGLAPIMGLVTDELQHKKNTAPIELIFGVRQESDIFWLERLETLARDYANFSYTLTLSQPTPTWQSVRGRVTAHLPTEVAHKKFYLCGSQEMVKDVRTLLVSQGVEAKDIHFEIF
jgi:ferredoxin-NADP reductase